MKAMWVLYIAMGGTEPYFPPTIVLDHFDSKPQCEAAMRVVEHAVTNGELGCMYAPYRTEDARND